MDKLLAQIILAAREDAEGWMNTLVLVLLMVFWAIGGILKARAKKTEMEDEEEEGKPTARPTATAKPMYKAQRAQVRRPQPPHIQADVKKIEAKQAKPSVTERKARGPEAAAAKVTGEWIQQARHERARQARQRVRAHHERAEKPASAEEEPAIEPLLSIEEPDELKKAILHYEILGKPVSLRKPMDEGLR